MAETHNQMFRVGSGSDKKLKDWERKLNRGIKRREPEMRRWLRNEKWDDLCQWGAGSDLYESWEFEDYEDRVTVNKVGAWINTRIASVLYKNPRFVLRPQKSDGYTPVSVPTVDPNTGEEGFREIPRYRLVEHVINYIVSQPSFGFNRTLRRACKSGLTSYGAAKVCYVPELRDADEDEFERDENGDVIIDPATGQPIRTEVLVKDRYSVDWVRPNRIIADPDGENEFYDHEWIATEFIEHIDDVKANKLFRNTKDLSPTARNKRDFSRDNSAVPEWEDYDLHDGQKADLVRYFEILDMKNRRIIVLADKHDKPLRNDEMPEWIDHSDYAFFRPVERPGHFYPRPPASDLVTINEEYNHSRTLLMRGTRAGTARKILAMQGALSEFNKEQLASPSDLEIIEVEDERAFAMQPVPTPQMSQDFFAYAAQIPRDFDEVAGSSGERRGSASSKTATQASIMEGGNALREDDMRVLFADFIREIGKKLLDCVQKNMNGEMVVSIVGRDGVAYQALIDHEDIVGDYDVAVDVEDMIPVNSDIERNQFIQFMSVFPAISPQLRAKRSYIERIAQMFRVRDSHLIDEMVSAAEEEIKMAQMMQEAASAAGDQQGVPATPDNESQMAEQMFGTQGGGV